MTKNQAVEIRVNLPGKSECLTLLAPRGETLRKVLLSEGLSPYLGSKKIFNCRGMGICGTCKVLVLEEGEWWEKRSCQIQCFKNLEIQLK